MISNPHARGEVITYLNLGLEESTASPTQNVPNVYTLVTVRTDTNPTDETFSLNAKDDLDGTLRAALTAMSGATRGWVLTIESTSILSVTQDPDVQARLLVRKPADS